MFAPVSDEVLHVPRTRSSTTEVILDTTGTSEMMILDSSESTSVEELLGTTSHLLAEYLVSEDVRPKKVPVGPSSGEHLGSASGGVLSPGAESADSRNHTQEEIAGERESQEPSRTAGNHTAGSHRSRGGQQESTAEDFSSAEEELGGAPGVTKNVSGDAAEGAEEERDHLPNHEAELPVEVIILADSAAVEELPCDDHAGAEAERHEDHTGASEAEPREDHVGAPEAEPHDHTGASEADDHAGAPEAEPDEDHAGAPETDLDHTGRAPEAEPDEDHAGAPDEAEPHDHAGAPEAKPDEDHAGVPDAAEPHAHTGTPDAAEPHDHTGTPEAEPDEDHAGAPDEAEPDEDHAGAPDAAEPDEDHGGAPDAAAEPDEDLHTGAPEQAEPHEDLHTGAPDAASEPHDHHTGAPEGDDHHTATAAPETDEPEIYLPTVVRGPLPRSDRDPFPGLRVIRDHAGEGIPSGPGTTLLPPTTVLTRSDHVSNKNCWRAFALEKSAEWLRERRADMGKTSTTSTEGTTSTGDRGRAIAEAASFEQRFRGRAIVEAATRMGR